MKYIIQSIIIIHIERLLLGLSESGEELSV